MYISYKVCKDQKKKKINVNTVKFYLLKVSGQVGSELDYEIPPHLQLGKQKSFSPDLDGTEGLHEELQALTAAQDICSRESSYKVGCKKVMNCHWPGKESSHTY